MNTHAHHHCPVRPWLLQSGGWAVSIVSSLKLPWGLGLLALEGAQGSWRGRLHHRRFSEHTGQGVSLTYDFSFMGKWPSAVSFQALEKCLIVSLGAPLTGQRSAERTPLHVSRRRGTGSPGMALSWGRFGISFHTTALAATPWLLILLFPEVKGRRKMHSPERSRNL